MLKGKKPRTRRDQIESHVLRRLKRRMKKAGHVLDQEQIALVLEALRSAATIGAMAERERRALSGCEKIPRARPKISSRS